MFTVLPFGAAGAGTMEKKNAMIPVTVAHTGIVVWDMDGMLAFYQDMFGFEKVLDTSVAGKAADNIVGFHVEKERIAILQLVGIQIELLEYRPAGRGYPDDYRSNDLLGVHLALQTGNMDRAYEMLKKEVFPSFRKHPRPSRIHTPFSPEPGSFISPNPRAIPWNSSSCRNPLRRKVAGKTGQTHLNNYRPYTCSELRKEGAIVDK